MLSLASPNSDIVLKSHVPSRRPQFRILRHMLSLASPNSDIVLISHVPLQFYSLSAHGIKEVKLFLGQKHLHRFKQTKLSFTAIRRDRDGKGNGIPLFIRKDIPILTLTIRHIDFYVDLAAQMIDIIHLGRKEKASFILFFRRISLDKL